MGTNYYARVNCCVACGRYEELHIGKASAGWKFSFRGYRDHQPPITSESDWRKFLVGVPIFDEYRKPVTYDDFWANAKSPKRADMRDHINYCLSSPTDREWMRRRLDAGTEWHDDQGNSFSGTEFS